MTTYTEQRGPTRLIDLLSGHNTHISASPPPPQPLSLAGIHFTGLVNRSYVYSLMRDFQLYFTQIWLGIFESRL